MPEPEFRLCWINLGRSANDYITAPLNCINLIERKQIYQFWKNLACGLLCRSFSLCSHSFYIAVVEFLYYQIVFFWGVNTKWFLKGFPCFKCWHIHEYDTPITELSLRLKKTKKRLKKLWSLNLVLRKMLLVHFSRISETTTIVDAATLHFLQVDNFEGW